MNFICFLGISLILNTSCNNNNIDDSTTSIETVDDTQQAKIVSVSVSGEANSYNFSVGILSPDEGCNQYADWWEVISEDGTLIYRRVLGHSHVSEQPFVRSGGPVSITQNQTVIIRAHMNNSGYGAAVYKGSVSEGFVEAEIASDFANELANQAPLPTGCTF